MSTVPSSEELARRTIARRAAEAAIWGMPVVNYDLMLQDSSEVKRNADGSVDVYVGPNAPAGSNWLPTDPARGFELMFRLYAPTKALFDKAWKLPDLEEAM